ncbi:MAG: lysophospholipid acyltransferase family protein [Akkermansia sp.]|nr:lysophospholipid acyltransferase family protein [Akkermansia sp.]MBQ8375847.1 lysophospholipid acyltransferase family protein [Akkermansia sp.]
MCATLRKRVILKGNAGEILGKKQCIIALWHNRTFTPCYVYRYCVDSKVPMSMLTSASKDGALLSTVAGDYGMRTVRGSSHRRGAVGFRDMLRELNEGCCMCITPDGPKGPRYKSRAGVIRLASVSGLPILPLCVDIPSCWRIKKAWDGFVIPKPFSRVNVLVREPLHVPSDIDEETQKEYMEKLDELLACGRPDFDFNEN